MERILTSKVCSNHLIFEETWPYNQMEKAYQQVIGGNDNIVLVEYI